MTGKIDNTSPPLIAPIAGPPLEAPKKTPAVKMPDAPTVGAREFAKSASGPAKPLTAAQAKHTFEKAAAKLRAMDGNGLASVNITQLALSVSENLNDMRAAVHANPGLAPEAAQCLFDISAAVADVTTRYPGSVSLAYQERSATLAQFGHLIADLHKQLPKDAEVAAERDVHRAMVGELAAMLMQEKVDRDYRISGLGLLTQTIRDHAKDEPSDVARIIEQGAHAFIEARGSEHIVVLLRTLPLALPDEAVRQKWLHDAGRIASDATIHPEERAAFADLAENVPNDPKLVAPMSPHRPLTKIRQ